MKKAVFFILAIALHGTLALSQAPDSTALPKDPATGLVLLLKPGKHRGDIYDKPTLTPRQKDLSDKIKKVYQQIADSDENNTPKDSAAGPPSVEAYMKKYGITWEDMEEYEKIRTSRSQLVITAQDTLTITRKGTRIAFKSSGINKALDSLQLDMATNTVRYKKLIIPYSELWTEKSDKNPFKSAVSAYTFLYKDPSKPVGDPLTGLAKSTSVRIEFVIGRLEKTGQSFLTFYSTETKNGETQPATHIVMVFD